MRAIFYRFRTDSPGSVSESSRREYNDRFPSYATQYRPYHATGLADVKQPQQDLRWTNTELHVARDRAGKARRSAAHTHAHALVGPKRLD